MIRARVSRGGRSLPTVFRGIQAIEVKAQCATFLGLGPAPTFEQTVLLYPLVTLAHVCEEWRRFTRWAQRHGSPRYSRRQYVVTHLAGIALATSGALLVRAFPSGLATLAFIGLLFGPSIACNALFHIGANLLTRAYCPGVVTSVVLYLPVALLVLFTVVRDGILSRSTVVAAMLGAAGFHVREVGHKVFKRW